MAEEDEHSYDLLAQLKGEQLERLEAEKIMAEKRRKRGLVLPVLTKNWGVKRRYLEDFDYASLQDTFCGIHNLSIPRQILELEYPDEILANYIGIAKIKSRGIPLILSFISMVEELQRVALRRSINHLKEKLIENIGERTQLSERLKGLDEKIRLSFMLSCVSSYMFSDRENPDKGVYHDPNIDGRNKRIYVNRIMEFLTKQFEQAYRRS